MPEICVFDEVTTFSKCFEFYVTKKEQVMFWCLIKNIEWSWNKKTTTQVQGRKSRRVKKIHEDYEDDSGWEDKRRYYSDRRRKLKNKGKKARTNRCKECEQKY